MITWKGLPVRCERDFFLKTDVQAARVRQTCKRIGQRI